MSKPESKESKELRLKLHVFHKDDKVVVNLTTNPNAHATKRKGRLDKKYPNGEWRFWDEEYDAPTYLPYPVKDEDILKIL